jgi:hypothetical protein
MDKSPLPKTERQRIHNESKLTAERARQLLKYDPETGALTWLVTNSNRAVAGSLVGRAPKPNGYMQSMVDGVRHSQHRLAWLIWHGKWPSGDIDHINGNPADNRLVNLRDASKAINMQNQRRLPRNNSSGMVGVRPRGRRFTAQIQVDGKAIHLGTFDTAALADAARVDAKRRLHPGCTI